LEIQEEPEKLISPELYLLELLDELVAVDHHDLDLSQIIVKFHF
jgi:hypothetical protein